MTFINCPDCSEITEIVDHFVLPKHRRPVEHVRTQRVRQRWFMTPLIEIQNRD